MVLDMAAAVHHFVPRCPEAAAAERFKVRIRKKIKRFLGALWSAVNHFNNDDGWAVASHIAMSGILALFPFLIFCTSLAAFVHLGNFPQEAVQLIYDTMPDNVAGPLAIQIEEVLTIPRGDLLTFGAAAALFFASSGVEALRLGLNRAYRVQETRHFVITRLQSIGFVLVAAIVIATVTFLLILMPLGLDIAKRYIPWLSGYVSTIDFWRLVVSTVILVLALVACHKWLPAGGRTLLAIAPGVILTLICWLAAAMAFSAYLRIFASYVTTYAGMASVMIALVFFYLMAVIFLLGGEINSALIELRSQLQRERRVHEPETPAA